MTITSDTVEYRTIQCCICINISVYRCIGWSQWPLACLDCGFESRQCMNVCLLRVLCVR